MTLDENDYLTFQLYTASKTPRIKKTRMRSWILTTVAFLCQSWAFYEGNSFFSIYFLIFSVLSLLFYPLYSRWRYKRHYLKHIRDTYKNRFGVKCAVEITKDSIVTHDKTGSATINTSEVDEINEIRNYYFIKTTSGTSLIISKIKSEDLTSIEKEIKLLVNNKGIRHNIELNWKWK